MFNWFVLINWEYDINNLDLQIGKNLEDALILNIDKIEEIVCSKRNSE